ncbi:MAG: ubiquinol-cytochrome c reductase iron-sulfur subunit [Anaerolineae bacterium]|nr:ubiquinol-cytochrome c reductase iron-sulfur subunit [Thermoflexales bacterium]MDW8408835.1 ubiquinol-cytochrome c reductase iron-sulfur subunit [Anaerolineae bacterium]
MAETTSAPEPKPAEPSSSATAEGGSNKPAAKAAAAPAGAPSAAAAKPAAPAAKPAAKPAEAAPPAPPKGVTRREFLNYVWGASMALMLVQTVGISVLFALPRFREGEFGGKIRVSTADFPAVNTSPTENNLGKFWMVHTDQGIQAIYKVCTHLGCLYFWDDLSKRFACPCHGSQFEYNGKWIAGPAPRDLDRFAFEVLDANDTVIAESPDGKPLPLPANAAAVLVNTGRKTLGDSHF